MSDEHPVTLADAYALVTPEDSRDLYARWAATYESEFVALNQYVIPDRVAEVFAEFARPVDGPVLDIGCGTGLVAIALVRDASGDAGDWVIDGVDISPEMLAMSAPDQFADELAAGTSRDLVPKIVDTYLPGSEHYGHTTLIAVFRRTETGLDGAPIQSQ